MIIEAQSLTYRYDSQCLAVDGLSCAVGPGEVYCLLGGTGTGKSTAVSLFMARRPANVGKASICGIDCARDPIAVRQKTVFVTPEISGYLQLSVIDNLMFFARVGGLCDGPLREAAEDAMRNVGIADRCFDRPLGGQSRGISVLLWLALATLRDAQALILDEPTTGLNSEDTRLVIEALREQRDAKRAVLITTADLHFATSASDRVAVLKAGRKVLEQGVQGLLGRSLTELLLTYADLPFDAPRGSRINS